MEYDIVIVGSGVAGLTAGIYAARAGKKTLIIENSILGGTTATLDVIENYPGFDKISGSDLVQKIFMQASSLGVNIEFYNIKSIEFKLKKIVLSNNDSISYGALIIATGISNKKLKLANADKYLFKGISYCAVCDGALYKNKNIAVLTDGNIGKSSIEYLSNLTDKIIALDISNKYTNDKIKVYHNTEILEVKGEDKLTSIIIKSNGENTEINLDALFINLGKENDLNLFKEVLEIKNNFLVTNEDMQTNIDSVFVAGDIRFKSLRQIVTACSDGAIAANSAIKYLQRIK